MILLKILVVIIVIIQNSYCESETNFETNAIENDLDENYESLLINTEVEQIKINSENSENITFENERTTALIDKNVIIDKELEQLNDISDEQKFTLGNEYDEIEDQLLLEVNETFENENLSDKIDYEIENLNQEKNIVNKKDEIFGSSENLENITKENVYENLTYFKSEENLMPEENEYIENEEISENFINEIQNENEENLLLVDEQNFANEKPLISENFFSENQEIDEFLKKEQNLYQDIDIENFGVSTKINVNENSTSEEKSEISHKEIPYLNNDKNLHSQSHQNEYSPDFEDLTSNQYDGILILENENFNEDKKKYQENKEQLSEYENNFENSYEIMENSDYTSQILNTNFEYQKNPDYFMFKEQQNTDNEQPFFSEYIYEQTSEMNRIFEKEDEKFYNKELPLFEENYMNQEQYDIATEENIAETTINYHDLFFTETTSIANFKNEEYLTIENDEKINYYESSTNKVEKILVSEYGNHIELNNENNFDYKESINIEDKTVKVEENENISDFDKVELPIINQEEEDTENQKTKIEFKKEELIEENTENNYQINEQLEKLEDESFSENGNGSSLEYEAPQEENYFGNYSFEQEEPLISENEKNVDNPLFNTFDKNEEISLELHETTKQLKENLNQEVIFNNEESSIEQTTINSDQQENLEEYPVYENLKEDTLIPEISLLLEKEYSPNQINDNVENKSLISEKNLNFQGDYDGLKNFRGEYELSIDKNVESLNSEYEYPLEETYPEKFIEKTEQFISSNGLNHKENYIDESYIEGPWIFQNNFESFLPQQNVFDDDLENFYENFNYENYYENALYSYNYIYPTENYNNLEDSSKSFYIENYISDPDEYGFNYEENFYDYDRENNIFENNLKLNYYYYTDKNIDFDNLDFDYYIYKDLENYFENYIDENKNEDLLIPNNDFYNIENEKSNISEYELPDQNSINFFSLENYNFKEPSDNLNDFINEDDMEEIYNDQNYYMESKLCQSNNEILEQQVKALKNKELMLEEENKLLKIEMEMMKETMKSLKEFEQTLYLEGNFLENNLYQSNNQNSILEAQVQSGMNTESILRQENEVLKVKLELMQEDLKNSKHFGQRLFEEKNYLEDNLYQSKNEISILRKKITVITGSESNLKKQNYFLINENTLMQKTIKNLRKYELSLNMENEILRMKINKINHEKLKCHALLPDLIEELSQYQNFLETQKNNFIKNLQNSVDILKIKNFECNDANEKCANENNKLQNELKSSRNFVAELLDDIIPIKIDNLKIQQFAHEMSQFNQKKNHICNDNIKLIEKLKIQLAHMQNEIEYLHEYYVINTKILLFELIDELDEIREQNRKLRSKNLIKVELILYLQNEYNESKSKEMFTSILNENLKIDIKENEILIYELQKEENQKNHLLSQILFDNEQKDQIISKISHVIKEKNQLLTKVMIDKEQLNQMISKIMFDNEEKERIISQVLIDCEHKINEMELYNYELENEKNQVESENINLERHIDYLENVLLEDKNFQTDGERNHLLQEKYTLLHQNENLEKEKYYLNVKKNNLEKEKDELNKEKNYLEKINDNLEKNKLYLKKQNDYFMKIKSQLEKENDYLKRRNEYLERQKNYLQKQTEYLNEENHLIDESTDSFKNFTTSQVLIDHNNIKELKFEYKNQIKDLKAYNDQLEQINYDLEQKINQLEKLKQDIENEKNALKSLNSHLERNLQIHKLQDMATIQYSVNEYLFHKYEYEQMIGILHSLKYIQHMHQQVKDSILNYDQNNREQFEDFQNDQEELIENWENSNDTCIVAVFEKERKIERMSKLTKNLINEVEDLQAKLNKKHHSNCHDFFSDEMIKDPGQKDDAEDLLNKTSHLLKIVESTQMENFDIKEQLINFETLQHIETIENAASNDSDLESINKEIKLFWDNWNSRLEKNSMGVNFARRSFKNEIDFELYHDSKAAEIMKRLYKADDEKMKIYNAKSRRVLETANLLKNFMENQQTNKTMSERIESNDEIIDIIESLKMQSISDDSKIHLKTAEIQDLFDELKIVANDEENHKITTYIKIEVKVLKALLKKRDLILKVENNKIDAELEAIIKKREELFADQKEIKKNIDQDLEALELIGDAIRLFETELNMCQRRIIPDQITKKKCDAEIEEIEVLKREIKELSKENKKCKTTFSLFPMLLG